MLLMTRGDPAKGAIYGRFVATDNREFYAEILRTGWRRFWGGLEDTGEPSLLQLQAGGCYS